MKAGRQTTLRTAASVSGVGVHSGAPATLNMLPAEANTGVVFVRLGQGGLPDREVRANVRAVTATEFATVIGDAEGPLCSTAEHVLAALTGLGVDNAVIEIDGAEAPIMDGSSAPFLYLVQEAGVKRLASSRRYLKILRPVQIANGDKRIAIYPSDHFKVSYTISFDHPLLRHQSRTERITEQSFAESIAPARTFGFLKDVEMLRQNGLALGGSLENAIVIGDAGVLNALRFEDEFVRHKILDVVGDLALVGHPIVGHVVAHRAGHALHTALAARLLEECDAWVLVESTIDVMAMPAGVPAAARVN
jgi:UDP-3-O-[3-hydroxymyristoyl] N-acetylglucosamine deacetylase